MMKPLHHHLHDYFFPHERNNHRPNLFSAMSVAALVLMVIVFEAGYLVQTRVVFLNTNFLASVLPGVLADLTNEARAENGIAPVTRDPLLDTAAQAAANDMASKGYFAHVSPDGKTPWYWLDQAGYSYSYAGENLAVNFTDSENVQTAWMESPTHHANIVKPQYTQIGFGTASGAYEGKETTFVVEFFAAPAVSVAEKAAPASAVLAPPSVAEQTATSAPSAKVLGSETEKAAAALAVSSPPGWLARMLASPLNTLETILTVLFAIIVISLATVIFIRGKAQHPSVIIGGALLTVLILGAMLFSVLFSGPVLLPVDNQTASVYMALP